MEHPDANPLTNSESDRTTFRSCNQICRLPSGIARINSCNRPTFMKYYSVVTVVLQCTASVLLARYVRTRPGDMFFTSTAVVFAEVFKFFASAALIYNETGSVSAFTAHIHRYIFTQPYDNLKISVPALIYVAQNNLIYVAVSNLDATTFLVSSQLKILTTALFSVAVLRKRLSAAQWLSMLILFGGVSLVQFQPSGEKAVKKIAQTQQPLLGAVAVTTAAVMSGFAGVYFEKLLKNTEQSLWVRNLQLSFLGIVFGLLTAFGQDGALIRENGFFFGYNSLVWILIGVQSFGGLMIAMVIKYADNIIKGFATSASIVLACALSVVLFDFQITQQFAFGTMLVITAVYVYSCFPPAPTAPSTANTASSPAKLSPSSSQALGVANAAIELEENLSSESPTSPKSPLKPSSSC